MRACLYGGRVTQSPEPTAVSDPAGAVREPTVTGLPDGYTYGVTRYADIILQQAFPTQFEDIVTVLSSFRINLGELRVGGGGRTVFVSRFDGALEARGWGKKTIEIGKTIDGKLITNVRGHEIDMFSVGSEADPYPGIAVEMEWNNKDPFYDRDLLNYQALHREGALGVGVIITRGAVLQSLLERTVLHAGARTSKYGKASTHWNKLVPRVNLGGGGECPLLLIGIEPPRIDGGDIFIRAMEKFRLADELKRNWRGKHGSRAEAALEAEHMIEAGYALLES